jgi:hypothetical protein
MAKSRRESPLFSISFLPQEGGTGVTKGFAEGKKTVPGPGRRASLDLLALDGRGLR